MIEYTYQVQRYDADSTDWQPIDKTRHTSPMQAWQSFEDVRTKEPESVLRIAKRIGTIGKVTDVIGFCGEVHPQWSRNGPDHRVAGSRRRKGGK